MSNAYIVYNVRVKKPKTFGIRWSIVGILVGLAEKIARTRLEVIIESETRARG